ncbi:MAG: META domain-containing protein [Chitinophagaceae bacterium]|nr:META domain-containing protein [Chitinophagaceae bacterium]
MRQFFLIFSIVCLITACDTAKKAASGDVNSSPLTGTKWRLTELDGKPVAEKINGKEPFLELQEVDKRYAASGGCNGIGGQFTLSKNGRIKFSQGMSTMMACENMEVETQLKNALIATDNYTINGNTLSLNKAGMAPLARFQAVNPSVAIDSNQHSQTAVYGKYFKNKNN